MGAMVSGRARLAISERELCIAEPGELRPTVTRVPLDPADSGAWPSLMIALRDLVERSGATTFSVALLAPLAETRQMQLPRLDESELLQLLGRNAARYFVSARGSQTIGAVQTRGARGEASSVVAVAAPTRVITAIDSAARGAGAAVDVMIPAEAAWAQAAAELWPAFARRQAHVLVLEDDRTTLMELDRGALANVRRFRAGGADAELIADAITGSSAGAGPLLGILGKSPDQAALTRSVSARGIQVQSMPAAWDGYAESPDALAAVFANGATGPRLASDAVRAEARARIRRVTVAVMGVAAVLVFAAGALELWGIHRELRAVKAERDSIRPQVEATLVGRTSVEDAYRRLTAVVSAERGAPHWASVLADLTERLPDDAYLTTVRTRADSLVVDGMAASASEVFDAVTSSPNLLNVRAPAPVRRLAPDGGDPMERFTLAAVLPKPASTPARPGKGATR